MTSPGIFLTDAVIEEARARGEQLAGEPLAAFQPVAAGRNSLVVKIVTASGRNFALKRHRQDSADPRNRLQTEEAALEFLSRHGVECVPNLVASDAKNGWLLMEWVDGGPPAPSSLGDIDAALDFAARLHRLSGDPAATALADASEACFCGDAILSQIETRRTRLMALSNEPALARFLTDFSAALGSMKPKLRATPSFGVEIPVGERTLSPSDFGFHNAVRRPDGTLVFIDFEYFGWDDPAKLAADFVLHPGMTLGHALKVRFVDGAVRIFGENGPFFTRFQRFLPLYGLRWCMILLREYLPGQEIAWSEDARTKHEQRKSDQLDKAWHMLSTSVTDFEAFPYGS